MTRNADRRAYRINRFFCLLAVVALIPVPRIFSDGCIGTDANQTFARINELRKADSLPSLELDEAATLSAQRHADELAERYSLSHLSLDGSRAGDRYRMAGGGALHTGENLGAGDTVDQIVSAWMNSPGHRENLLNPAWTKIGIGIHVLDSGRLIIVAVFNDSRFRLIDTSLDKDDQAATVLRLTGELRLSAGVFPRSLWLRVGSEAYEPTTISRTNGGLHLGFAMPLPGEWIEGRPAAFELHVLEGDLPKITDLYILHPLHD